MSYNGTSTRYMEPKISKISGTQRGLAQGRWGWWYSSIADLMIRHPEWKIQDIALRLNKHPNTVSLIIHTDMFKEYFAQRKDAWRQDHDHALRAKLTDVATEGLDIVLEQLRTKRTAIPFNVSLKVMESALDRLGYAPDAAPAVVVNNSVHDNRQQTVQVNGVSASDLEEARAAMRLVERQREGTSLAPPAPVESVLEQGVELGDGDVIDVQAMEAEDAPAP